MSLAEPLMVTQLVVLVLEQLGVPYFVGGSLASSLYGLPRSTQDADLIADLKLKHIEAFVEAFQEDFYVNKNMIEDAIQRNSSFNIIHLETMFKVDLFLLKTDLGSQKELERREKYLISEEPLQELYLASVEDVILHKLNWFKKGNEISERQWNDALGVLKVQRAHIDLDYMHARASDLGVNLLLTKLLQQQ